jgi:hypothetical protein
MMSEGMGTQQAEPEVVSFPRQILDSMRRFHFSERSLPWAFLGAVILSYGIFIPLWGLYGDDWIYMWNYHVFGAGSFVEFVAVDRPFSAWIYVLTTPIFGENAWPYHLLLLGLRWMSAFLLWKILRIIWPQNGRQTGWVALLFAIYPGFQQQPIAVQFILHFATLDLTLFSIWAMLRSVQEPGKRRVLTVLVLAASLSIFGIEYFMGFELLRPLLVWMALRDETDRKQRLKSSLLAWVPYLIVFVAFIIWRVFIFSFPTYEPELIYGLREAPLDAVMGLAKRILADLKTVLYGAWRNALKRPDGSLNLYILLSGGTFILSLLYMAKMSPETAAAGQKKHWIESWPVQAVVLGVISFAAVGWPFWVPNVPLNLAFPWDRSLLPFMMGACLVLVALVDVIVRPKAQVVILSGLVALAVGFHYQNALIYRDEWNNLQSYFWQMAWRMPDLEKGTVVISDNIPLWRFSDNDLTPLVNWIYAPELETGEMDYKYFDMSTRVGSPLPGLEEDLTFSHGYRNTSFTGSTSDVLAIYYQAPGCMKVLDPNGDMLPANVPDTLLETLHLSHTDQIVTAAPSASVPPRVLGAEPEHDWCFYFTRAALAQQAADWQTVVAMGQAADTEGFSAEPGFGDEYLPFIEGYARTGDFDRAFVLTDAAAPDAGPGLCKLWNRIEQSSQLDEAEVENIHNVKETLGCSS